MSKIVSIWLFLCFPFLTIGQESHTKKLTYDLENQKELSTWVDSIVTSEMKREFLPGVALAITDSKKIIYQKAYGFANLEKAKNVSITNTIFRIGSITKVFTALALMQLVDNKKIALEDEVNQFLEPELRLKDNYSEPVRIWHLLTHTAGFDQKLQGRIFPNRDERPDLGTFLIGELIRIRPPGQISSYDTYGISLAGRIIENVSGMSYPAYLKKHIFDPLGMSHTSVEVEPNLSDDLAVGYGYEDGRHIPQQYELYATLPASSIDATTEDMAKFMQALLGDGSNSNGRILSPETIAQIKKNQFTNQKGFPGFSYGFWEDFFHGQRSIHHGGIMRGFTSNLHLFQEAEIGFYVVYNRDFETGPNPRLRDILGNALKERWFGEKDTTQDTPGMGAKDTIDTGRFAGTYADILYCHTCFEGEGAGRSIFPINSLDKGVISFQGIKFYADGPLSFTDEKGNYKIAFRENNEKEITHAFGNFGSDATYEKLGEALLEEVLGDEYSDSKASPFKAMTYRGLGNWEKAINEYEKIVALRPQDGRAYYYLASCYLNDGKWEEAIAAHTISFELGKWKSYNAITIAELYLTKKNYEKTYEWLAKIITSAREMGQATDEIKEFVFENPVLNGLKNDERALELFHEK